MNQLDEELTPQETEMNLTAEQEFEEPRSEYFLTETQRNLILLKSPLNVVLEFHHQTSNSISVVINGTS